MMPRSASRKTDNVLTMPSVESPPVEAIGLAGVTENDIARRAFELYCDRGREDGYDLDDWLNAERELREAATSTAA
jgi:hypothetical protein